MPRASRPKKIFIITKATLESLPREFRLIAQELLVRGELKIIEGTGPSDIFRWSNTIGDEEGRVPV